MIRVLHVIAGVDLLSGGPTSALLGLLEMMQTSSARCSVAVGATRNVDERVLASIRALATSLHSWPTETVSPYGFSFGFSRNIGKLIRAHDVLHVHSMWNWPVYYAARLAWKAHVPVIFRPAGAMDEFDVRKHESLKKIIGPFALGRYFNPPNIFHCTATREQQRLVTYGGKARRRVLSLPVPAGPVVPAGARRAVRAQLGIPQDASVVLFMSRFNYKKGLELLLPALVAARRSEPDLHLILAGDGDKESHDLIARLIRQHRMESWVHRVGFVSGIPKAEILAASDLFALPSQNENFGVSVVEALAAGMPVLVSPEVYIVDDVAPHPAVCVCDRSTEEICSGVLRMLQERGRDAATLTDAARDLWTEHFTPEKLRPDYETMYSSVVSEASHLT